MTAEMCYHDKEQDSGTVKDKPEEIVQRVAKV
jgi:hypothetical protein